MIDRNGLIFLSCDALILAVVVLKPFTRTYDDSDRGGGSIVVMRPPLKASYWRCGAFIVLSFAVSFFLVGLQNPSVEGIYHNMVGQLISTTIHDPATVDRFAQTILQVFPVSVVAFGVAFALAFRAPLGRRLMILANVALFLVVSAVVDAFFGIFAIETGFPLGPTPVANLLIQYLVAGIVLFRIFFTSFQLPNKTPLPLRRGHDLRDDVVVVICVVTAILVTGGAATYLISKVGQDPLVAAVIAFACPPYLVLLIALFLGLLRLVGRRTPQPGPERPPVEVIIPAFNEELVIVDLLVSLDAAARNYQGPVRVVLCDDGSDDATAALASDAMAGFGHATGEVIQGRHEGKSGALNQALTVCRADFVFRVDADCTVDPDCFVYSVPHFVADPKLGILGAFTLPKEPYTTWIDRMRLFEMVVGFGFGRPCSDAVDGISCIPGTFTAFRREPAVEIGGFVEGMYGEDVDFTCAIARLGYRAVVDTRVRSYEDVPNTQAQLRVQRTRWNRGSGMAYARYVPIVTGLSGPRFWFFATRAAVKRLLVPLHFTMLAYILVAAALQPTSKLNLGRVGVIFLLRGLPSVLQVLVCSIYYRKARYLGWLPLRFGFLMLKHFYGLEAFLSFNARPVITASMRDAFRWRRSDVTAQAAELS